MVTYFVWALDVLDDCRTLLILILIKNQAFMYYTGINALIAHGFYKDTAKYLHIKGLLLMQLIFALAV